MATRTDKLHLSKLVLVNGGIGGMKLTYEKIDVRGNREFKDTYPSVHKKAAVTKDIEEGFKKLAQHLLEICGYVGTDDELEYLESRVEMTSINYTSAGFLLSGKLNVLEGNKSIALNTPLVADGNEYEKFIEVCSILDELKEDVHDYAVNGKTLTDVELLHRIAGQGKLEFDTDAVNKMSKEEQIEEATKFLEGNNSIVIHQSETPGHEEEGEEIGNIEEKIAKAPSEEKLVEASTIEEEENFGDDDVMI